MKPTKRKIYKSLSKFANYNLSFTNLLISVIIKQSIFFFLFFLYQSIALNIWKSFHIQRIFSVSFRKFMLNFHYTAGVFEKESSCNIIRRNADERNASRKARRRDILHNEYHWTGKQRKIFQSPGKPQLRISRALFSSDLLPTPAPQLLCNLSYP